MDISIIICTYNRGHNLPECIQCLEKQSLHDNKTKWEVLIVDNNSTDNTKAIIDKISAESTLLIRYLFEKNQGLSAARNKGISEALGKYLIFIDDDIRVTPIWLQSIYSTFQECDCDVVGGRIHVESPSTIPAWITPDMYGFLGHQDFGSDPHQMDGFVEFPFGGNMAIHRRVIEMIGNFDTNLGRKGIGLKKDELFKGEETDFFHRLANRHGSFYYQPTALVFHKILPHQLTKRFFLTLHNNAGRQKATYDNNKYARKILGVPLFIFPQLLRSISRFILISLTKGTTNSFRQLMTVSYFLGMISGYHEK